MVVDMAEVKASCYGVPLAKWLGFFNIILEGDVMVLCYNI